MTSLFRVIRSHFGNLVPTEILCGEEERDRKKYDVRIWKGGDSAVLIYELKVNSTWIQRCFPVPCWPHWSQIPQLLPYSLSSLWGWSLMTCHVHCPDGSLKLLPPQGSTQSFTLFCSLCLWGCSEWGLRKRIIRTLLNSEWPRSLRTPGPSSQGLPSSVWPPCVAMVWLLWRWD